MIGFRLQRLGLVMEPEPGNPNETKRVVEAIIYCLSDHGQEA